MEMINLLILIVSFIMEEEGLFNFYRGKMEVFNFRSLEFIKWLFWYLKFFFGCDLIVNWLFVYFV